MRTTIQPAKKAASISRFVLLFGLALALTTPAFAGQQDEALHQLITLVQLSSHGRTAADGLAGLEHLEHRTRDQRVPYLRAMLLIDRHRYPDALHPIRESLARSSGNMDAWKTRIWLAVVVKDYDDALASLEILSRRMPREGSVSSESERKCYEFCNDMGRIFGFLVGPVGTPAIVAKVGSTERAIAASLTGSRLEAFQVGREEVLDDFAARSQQIAELLRISQGTEADYRANALADLDRERELAMAELSEIEGLRVAGRSSASDERNTIAATRDKQSHSSSSGSTSGYRDNRVGVFSNRRRTGGSSYGSASSSRVDRGLGNRHYADVNRRQEDNDQRLTRRETDLKNTLYRIARDKAKLLRKPNTGISRTPGAGNGAMVLSMTSKAKALSTYMALPVDPVQQINQVLASYRAPARPVLTTVSTLSRP